MSKKSGKPEKALACGACGELINLFHLKSPKTAVGMPPYGPDHKVCPHCDAPLKVDRAIVEWMSE